MIRDHDYAIAHNKCLRDEKITVYSDREPYLEHVRPDVCVFELAEGCLTICPHDEAVLLGPNNTQWLLNVLRSASRLTAGLPADELTPEEAAALPDETRPWPTPMKDDFEDDVAFYNIADTYAHIAFQRNHPDEPEEEIRMCFDSISLRLLAARCLMAAEYLENKRLSIPYEQ